MGAMMVLGGASWAWRERLTGLRFELTHQLVERTLIRM